ncbi:hypothetical protein [Lysobacter enzymogenes]
MGPEGPPTTASPGLAAGGRARSDRPPHRGGAPNGRQ